MAGLLQFFEGVAGAIPASLILIPLLHRYHEHCQK